MQLAITVRAGLLRCVWCHEALAPVLAVRCPACAAVQHRECGDPRVGCATLGCARRVRPVPRGPIPPPAPVQGSRRGSWRLAASAALLVGSLLGWGAWRGQSSEPGPVDPQLVALTWRLAVGLEHPEQVGALAGQIASPRDARLASSAVRQVGLSASLPLRGAWRQPHGPRGRAWIMSALGDVGTPDALTDIRAGLEDPDVLVREEAFWALTRLCARWPALPLPPGLQDRLAPAGRGEAWPPTREEVRAALTAPSLPSPR